MSQCATSPALAGEVVQAQREPEGACVTHRTTSSKAHGSHITEHMKWPPATAHSSHPYHFMSNILYVQGRAFGSGGSGFHLFPIVLMHLRTRVGKLSWVPPRSAWRSPGSGLRHPRSPRPGAPTHADIPVDGLALLAFGYHHAPRGVHQITQTRKHPSLALREFLPWANRPCGRRSDTSSSAHQHDARPSMNSRSARP